MASAWQNGLAWLRAPATEVAFALRQTLRWSRGPAALPNEDKRDLFAFLAADERADAERTEAQLRTRCHLVPLAERSSRTTYLANLALLANLTQLGYVAMTPIQAATMRLVTPRTNSIGCERRRD